MNPLCNSFLQTQLILNSLISSNYRTIIADLLLVKMCLLIELILRWNSWFQRALPTITLIEIWFYNLRYDSRSLQKCFIDQFMLFFSYFFTKMIINLLEKCDCLRRIVGIVEQVFSVNIVNSTSYLR